MNPDRQPQELQVDRVEWVPSSPDVLEVRVFGAWHGSTVPPEAVLVVGDASAPALPDAIPAGTPPAWGAAFHAPVEQRAALEAGEGRLVLGDAEIPLPEALPGLLVDVGDEEEPGGTVVDPAVLAERRARRAEVAERSASQRAASAEHTADTLRAQLDQLEQRLARAGSERDGLAARVADAERQLRLAEQREEAERRRRVEVEEEIAEARRRAEAELESLRDRLAGAEEVAAVLERELATARRRAAEADRATTAEREARRAAETSLAQIRERLDELEAGTADSEEAEALRREAEALRDRAAELERDLVAERIARAAAERRAATPVISDRERELAEQVARLEAELPDRERLLARIAELEAELGRAGSTAREEELAARVGDLQAELDRRVQTQQRVQEAIAAVRSELDRVRSRVDSGHAGTESLRRELDALDARRLSLEEVIQLRDTELRDARTALEQARVAAVAARSDVDELRAAQEAADRAAAEARRIAGDLQLRLEQERRLRETAEQALAEARGERPEVEQRLAEMTAEVAAVRNRLHHATAELEQRIADERHRREAAEAEVQRLREERLREPGEVLVEPPADEPERTDALDTLLAGLRAQVASARRQLDELEAEEIGEPAPEASQPPETEAETSSPVPEVSRPPETAVSSAAAPEASPAAVDPTHDRLQQIEAELRAAVPAPGTGSAADMIASLQHAADRLRAAAEEELARAEGDTAPEAPAAPAAVSSPAASAAAPASSAEAGAAIGAPLTPRIFSSAPKATPWLRTAVANLAGRDPEMATELFIALLPAQAAAVDRLTYDVTTPESGLLRVAISNGGVRVERPAPDAAKAEVAFEGPLGAVAPLATGGAGWRLHNAKVRHGWLKSRKLVRARRRPLSLEQAIEHGARLAPGLLLAALAAAVDPAWTGGHRFAVDYALDRTGTWTVAAADGAPLVVQRRNGETGAAKAEPSATLTLSRTALLPLLAGTPLPDGERIGLTGDRRAVDALHAWFDGARGADAR